MTRETLFPSTSALRRRGKKGRKGFKTAEQTTEGREKDLANDFKDALHPLRYVDWYILVSLTAVALLIRFYRLGVPAAVVFDELHFLKFVKGILRREYIFDIHPPLGKQVLAYIGYILGFRPTEFVPDKIGKLYPNDVLYYRLRAISAAFGTATVPMTYLICDLLGLSKTASTFAAITMLFETLNIIESRLILMDSQLIFWCQVALFCALKLWKTVPKSKSRLKWLSLTGLASGTAFSVKHTALATPGLIAIVSFFGLHFVQEPLDLIECTYAGFLGALVYVLSFYFHFKALIYSGGKGDKFMKENFQRTLINHPKYDPSAKRPAFFRLFIYLNRRMVISNANIKKRHTWESDWYHWIVNWRGVLYFSQKDKISPEGKTLEKSIIYLLGNPVIIYMCLAATVLFVASLIVIFRYQKILQYKMPARAQRFIHTGIFLLGGWSCNLIPYLLVDRPAFIYHYIPGLFYSQVLAASIIDLLPHRPKIVVISLLTVSIVAAFIYWAPWTYSFSLTAAQHRARQWLPRWN